MLRVWRFKMIFGEISGTLGKCGEVWGSVGKCGEVWRSVGICRVSLAVIAQEIADLSNRDEISVASIPNTPVS